MIQIRRHARERPRSPLARPGRDECKEASQDLRALRRDLRAGAVERAVLLADVKAECLSQEA
jgi:hypothetical protein